MSTLAPFCMTLSFLTSMTLGLQQEQPQLYHSLVKVLNPEEEQVIENVIAQANMLAIASGPMNRATMNGTAH